VQPSPQISPIRLLLDDRWAALWAERTASAVGVVCLATWGALYIDPDNFSLNRAVGHIDDTALPGTDGNSGIAGHRDGFFRGLKDIGADDLIELEMLRGKEVYRLRNRQWAVCSTQEIRRSREWGRP
jgi:hypothetical protein